MTVRKVGVEEELLLVDPETGLLSQTSQRALRAYGGQRPSDGGSGDTGASSTAVPDLIELELFQSQLETNTIPCHELSDLRRELLRCRGEAAGVAATVDAAIVAVGTPVLSDEAASLTPNSRYRQIVHDFGETGRQALASGMHVHVDVDSDEEAIGVIDRLRPWLPVLLAISANSPFSSGVDTGYASWRAQVWGRWPTAGPAEPFGDVTGYATATQALIDSGAALDQGMLYLDARPAVAYPTVEIRVADVCTEIDDVLLVTALIRGLVETAAREWADGQPIAPWRVDLLRAARWRASKSGLGDNLVHPVEGGLRPARDAVDALFGYVKDALVSADDYDFSRQGFERLVSRGFGASRQRAVAEAKGDLREVVADLRRRTAASSAD